MGCDTYTVLVGNDVAGNGMTIEYAVIFAKAVFNEYWNDISALSVTIKREVTNDAED